MGSMMRHFAKIACLVAACAAGWVVLVNLADLFKGWIPPVGGILTLVIVFLALYFPLARPIADVIADRLAVAAHRGRHIRSGSGLDNLPTATIIHCTVCGGPGGPICRSCDEKLSRASRASLPAQRKPGP